MIKQLSKAFLLASGWKIEGRLPDMPKFVMIAAPHTSNWDFPYMMAISFAVELPIYWMGKDDLFAFPQGVALKKLGGIPVDRSKASNMVDQLVEAIRSHDRIALVVPAEGTRGRRDYWKSGFYHIARRANVPIVCGFLDFGRKVGGFGPTVVPSKDARADMDIIRRFYADKLGKHPERFTQPRLREEDEPRAALEED